MAKRQKDPLERFWSRVDRRGPTECWEWTGAKLPTGYAMFWPSGREGGKHYAHRFSFELHHRELRPGEYIDHLCRNRGCVNPGHLEAVSTSVNNRRALGWTINTDGVWFCARGHEIDEAVRFGGRVGCAPCRNEGRERWRKEGAQRSERKNDYNAAWKRQKKMDQLRQSHPGLVAEAEALGLPVVAQRLRHGWTYDKSGWIDLAGRRLPFGTKPRVDFPPGYRYGSDPRPGSPTISSNLPTTS